MKNIEHKIDDNIIHYNYNHLESNLHTITIIVNESQCLQHWCIVIVSMLCNRSRNTIDL